MTEQPWRPTSDEEAGPRSLPSLSATGPDKLLVLEEAAEVSRREVVTGTVRVSTRTDIRQEVAEISLDRNVIDVTRVPVGRFVDVAPAVRTEEDTTVVPVVEERFVVVKQLFLLEEIRIRHRVERETASVPVELRRQVGVVERVDPLGYVTNLSGPDPERPDQTINLGESHGHS